MTQKIYQWDINTEEDLAAFRNDSEEIHQKVVRTIYRPMAIEEIHPGLLWGRSGVLGLSICWEYGYLRWWDPATEHYLETQDQTADARTAAESRADTAEARVRELEAELERQRWADR